MTYLKAIEICKEIPSGKHSQEKILDAVEKILSMETINATPKEALLNIVQFFWENCVESEEETSNE